MALHISYLLESFSLPSDPTTELWNHNNILSCHTLFDTNRIFVVMSIPLLDYDSNFQIFKPFNLPIPVNLNSSDDRSFSMLTYSNIEAKVIGVNVQKTQYILLNNEGLAKCIQPGVNFYDIKSPIHRINLSKLCIVALFMNDNALIKENCKNTIKLMHYHRWLNIYLMARGLLLQTRHYE